MGPRSLRAVADNANNLQLVEAQGIFCRRRHPPLASDAALNFDFICEPLSTNRRTHQGHL
jgi:hypothetical protein